MKRATADVTRGRCTDIAIRPWSHCGSALRAGRVRAMTRMLSAALAAFLLAASPAAASGGGDTTPPAPEPTTDPCEPYWALPEIVNRTSGGCVVVGQTASR